MTTTLSTFSTADVAAYYDEYTPTYMAVTGDFIQAFRPSDTDSLMEYIAAGLDIRPGMRLLDAGCGVGAPALWLARQFPDLQIDSLTNSARQKEIARQKIAAQNLSDRVRVHQGDYHDLEALFAAGSFDRVMFLESLGHSHDLPAVFGGLRQVVRPGGRLYIKDFYRRHSAMPQLQEKIDQVIECINVNYCYNTMDLPVLIAALLGAGFSLDSVKRPDLATELEVTVAFENASQRLTYPQFLETVPADWYEIMAQKL